MVAFAWIGFLLIIGILLAIDLGLLHRKAKQPTASEALRWTGFCALLALLFNVVIYVLYENHYLGLGADPRFPSTGREAALQYFTAWLIEQSLSLDNVFVIAVIFSFFKIPSHYQHRVLFWGIIGALITRGVVIALGAVIIQEFKWTHYLFGFLLIYAAFKILLLREEHFNPKETLFYRLAMRFYPVTKELHGEKFFAVEDNVRKMTPLFLVLLLIEGSDVIFAIDSIPAVFGITQDPFIVFTSNIFALINLRSLYFALAVMVKRFIYLKFSMLFVLAFVGFKMLVHDFLLISTEVSFLCIVTILGLGIGASLVRTKDPAKAVPPVQEG